MENIKGKVTVISVGSSGIERNNYFYLDNTISTMPEICAGVLPQQAPIIEGL